MFFFSFIFHLIPCPIHWIVCVLPYLNFIFEFKAVLVLPKTAGSAQAHKIFIWSNCLEQFICTFLASYSILGPWDAHSVKIQVDLNHKKITYFRHYAQEWKSRMTRACLHSLECKLSISILPFLFLAISIQKKFLESFSNWHCILFSTKMLMKFIYSEKVTELWRNLQRTSDLSK